MRAILAIDSGGTKTDVLLVSPEGALLTLGRSRRDHPAALADSLGGFGRTETALQQALNGASSH
ncbi:MAG: hypothetical protein U1E27_04870, partial [Kiritimatiellia bacterium]|nr:hypothetical protein [Kiritimatiellia bacterium]